MRPLNYIMPAFNDTNCTPFAIVSSRLYICVYKNNLTLKHLLLVAISFGLFFSLYGQEKKDTFPSNGIMITPLLGLINDQILSLYYKRYLVNDTARYFNFRVGTELLSKVKHEFSAGREDKFSGVNWELWLEYGIRKENSSFYFGVELGRTVIETTGAWLIPEEGALFATGKYRINEFNLSNDGRMRMVSLHAFVGFRYHLNTQFSIGTEAALGRGWFVSPINYGSSLQVDEHTGRINDFTPVRFVSLQYSF